MLYVLLERVLFCCCALPSCAHHVSELFGEARGRGGGRGVEGKGEGPGKGSAVRVQAGVQLGVPGKSACAPRMSRSPGDGQSIMLQATPKKCCHNPNTKNTPNRNAKTRQQNLNTTKTPNPNAQTKPTKSRRQNDAKSECQKNATGNASGMPIVVLLISNAWQPENLMTFKLSMEIGGSTTAAGYCLKNRIMAFEAVRRQSARVHGCLLAY